MHIPARAHSRLTTLIVAIFAIGFGFTALPAPVYAAPATLLVSVSPLHPVVKSGEDMTWTVSWSCSSVTVPCTGAQIAVPIPSSLPAGVSPILGSATASTGDYSAPPVMDASSVRWTMKDPLNPGAAGTMTMTLRSQNLVTPNGTTYSPVATFTATNAAPVDSDVAASQVTVTSKAALTITKTRKPYDQFLEPVPGSEVTYQVEAQPQAQFAPQESGVWFTANNVITDSLPPGAIFVRAVQKTSFSLHDHVESCAYSAGVVTCPAFESPRAESVNGPVASVFVTVRYPIGQPASDTPTVQSDDGVTNTAQVTGVPFGGTEADRVTATAAVTHGFASYSGGPGLLVTKSNNAQVSTRPGDATTWVIAASNSGGQAADIVFDDRVPCALTSPVAAPSSPSPCAALGQEVSSVAATQGWFSNPVTIDYVLSDGATGSATLDLAQSSVSAPPDTFFTDLHVSTRLEPGADIALLLIARTPALVPTDPAGIPYLEPELASTTRPFVENCLSNIAMRELDATDWTTIPVDVRYNRHCSNKEIIPPAPSYFVHKDVTNSPQVIGGTVHFTVRLGNLTGTADGHPVFYDLLPDNLSLVPASVRVTYAEASSPAAGGEVISPTLDASAGRDLLTVSWPSVAWAPRADVAYVEFDAMVRPGTPAGTYSNTAYVDDSAAAVFGCNAPTQDELDLNGDHTTTDPLCQATTSYSVIDSGALESTKLVKGGLDAIFVAAPAVGHTSWGGSEFQILLKNSGNAPLQNVVAYDILPHVGDQAIGPAVGPRLSQWQPVFNGMVSVPPGVVVEYSTSTNPCRGEIVKSGGARASAPSGCNDTWTTSVTDPAAVRALRLSAAGPLAPQGQYAVTYRVEVPPTGADGIAWNSVSMAAVRPESGQWLQPAESPKVGLAGVDDLELAKSVSAAPHVQGATVTYRLDLTNRGVASGRGVEVHDVLPDGVTYVSSAPSKGSYDPPSGLWRVGDLAPGGAETLVITVRVDALPGGVVTNRAQVGADGTVDADSRPGNLGPAVAEDDEAEASLTVTSAAPLPSTGAFTSTVLYLAVPLMGLGLLALLVARRRRAA